MLIGIGFVRCFFVPGRWLPSPVWPDRHLPQVSPAAGRLWPAGLRPVRLRGHGRHQYRCDNLSACSCVQFVQCDTLSPSLLGAVAVGSGLVGRVVATGLPCGCSGWGSPYWVGVQGGSASCMSALRAPPTLYASASCPARYLLDAVNSHL